MLTTHAAIEGLRSSVTLPASSLSPSALACFAHWLRVPVNSPGLRAYSSSAMLRSGSVATALRIGAELGRSQGVDGAALPDRTAVVVHVDETSASAGHFRAVVVHLDDNGGGGGPYVVSTGSTTRGPGRWSRRARPPATGLDGLDHPGSVVQPLLDRVPHQLDPVVQLQLPQRV